MKLHHKSRQSGFTLIELLAVVAILGILAGIGIPRIFGALDNARTGADDANVRLLQSAVEQWGVINNPGGTAPGWGPLISANAITTLGTTPYEINKTTAAPDPVVTSLIEPDLVPQFINAIPVAPAGLRTFPANNNTGYGLQFADQGGRWVVTVVKRP